MNDAYLEDASGFRGHADRVIVAHNEREVIDVLRQAVPVTIAGAGTGITGGRVAQGGSVLSLEKLNRLDVRSGSANAGPGVLLRDLHAAAGRTGQFYAPETAASLGGTIATNASGSRSFRYGDTRRHVLRLRVVLAGGRVLDVRRGDRIDFEVANLPLPDTTKHTAGYRLQTGMDWIDLFIGSEGTLGVVTEAEVRLLPAPQELFSGVVFFPDEERAIAAVEPWRPVAGLRMLEYFDTASLKLLGVANAGAAILFEQEISGNAELDPGDWEPRLTAAGALLGASWFAGGAADREKFRQFRHALPEKVNEIVRRNGFMKMGSDYAVPLARNREMLSFYRRRCEETFPRQFVIFGHIGDAHVHVNLLPESGKQCAAARDLLLEFARQAVAYGGTVSAEHGLGKRKAHLLEIQFTADQIEVMKAVKRRLDPQWLLGRGTLFRSASNFS